MRIPTLKERYVISVEDKHLLLSACPIRFLPVLLNSLLKRFPIGIIGKHPSKGLPRMGLRLRIEFQLDHPSPSQERLQVSLRLAHDFCLALTFHDNHGPLVVYLQPAGNSVA